MGVTYPFKIIPTLAFCYTFPNQTFLFLIYFCSKYLNFFFKDFCFLLERERRSTAAQLTYLHHCILYRLARWPQVANSVPKQYI